MEDIMCENHDSETVFFDNQLEFKENKAIYVIEAHYDDKMEDLVTKIKKLIKYEYNKSLDIY
jgi:hypothetical protein